MSKVALGTVIASNSIEIESLVENLEELLLDKVQATEEWFGVHKLLVATMTTRRAVPEFALPMNTEVAISDTDRWPKVILLVRMVADEINRRAPDEAQIEEIYTWMCKFAIYKGGMLISKQFGPSIKNY